MDEKTNSLHLTFCGGTGIVTGANFLLETASTNILIDCGMIQGPKYEREKNRDPFLYNPAKMDYLFVTHAHADHIGRIGKLVKDGFRGKIYSTPATKDLVVHMFDDAVKIVASEARRDAVEPLYTKHDTELALSLWQTFEYYTELKDVPDFTIVSRDAGHVLGSALFEFIHIPTNKKIVFTGDLGNSPTPLLKDTDPVSGADYMVIESVYGDRKHEQRESRKIKLKAAIIKILERGGTCMIPVFSLEKTQILLHEINDMVEANELPRVPIFFDSPLASKLTKVYSKYTKHFNKHIQDEIQSGDDVFDFPGLSITANQKESQRIHKEKGPKIIIASSGMSEGGRINSHELKYLPDAKNGMIIIGYQVGGSLGRRIKEGQSKIFINKKPVHVKAEIISVNGYSSHKDSDGLVDFVSGSADTLKKVFVAMGEPKSSLFLSQRIHDYLGVDAVVPDLGQTFELK